MQEAGFGPTKKLTSRSRPRVRLGQMLPLPDERISAAALAECYFDVQLDVHRMEYAVHQLAARRQDPSAKRRQRDQRHLCGDGPVLRHGALLQSSIGAAGVEPNWGFINNPKFDELVTKARQTFDPAARDAALAELHAASWTMRHSLCRP